MIPWQPAGGPVPYRAGTLHVWLAIMPEGWQGEAPALSSEERARAARLVFDSDRAHFRFHHTALRTILAGYLGLAPAWVPLVISGNGKPALAPPWDGWRFNLSHSGPAALVGVSQGRPVGVDIERIRPMPAALGIARRFFSRGEQEALEALAPREREPAFFACWTRKEAFLKATGEGLGRGLGGFTLPVDPDDPGPWPVAEGWTVLALPPVPGYACAAAVEGGPVPVETRAFQP